MPEAAGFALHRPMAIISVVNISGVNVKANIYEISSDSHQLHYIPLHHFTI